MSDSTYKQRSVKRGVEFDGPGAQASDPIMTELPGEGTVHYNHSARMIHFVDGSFVAPGFGLPLSGKALEHPGVKALLKSGDLKTERPGDAPTNEDTARLVHDSGNIDRTAEPLNVAENTGS